MSNVVTLPPAKPAAERAVMASRREPPDSLEFFPTPPWATRALFEHVLTEVGPSAWHHGMTAWDPCAGEGHMAAVLAEGFQEVWRTDVHDYGGLNGVGSFVGEGADRVLAPSPSPDWIVFNPPFSIALEFVERSLVEAVHGVAALVRMQWLEGGQRYARLFRVFPPSIVAPFAERVPMHKGRWEPDGSTATAYVWCVWARLPRLAPQTLGTWPSETRMIWIPPGCRSRLERADDRARFAGGAS